MMAFRGVGGVRARRRGRGEMSGWQGTDSWRRMASIYRLEEWQVSAGRGDGEVRW